MRLPPEEALPMVALAMPVAAARLSIVKPSSFRAFLNSDEIHWR